MSGRGRGTFAPARAGATAGAAPQLNTDRLRATVDQLEEMKREFRGFRDRAEDSEKRSREREKVLYAENKLLKAELAAIRARVRYLEDLQGIEPAEEEPEAEGGAEAEGDAEGAGSGSSRIQRDVGATPEEIALSTYHEASNEIKEVVGLGFSILMDVPKIDGKNLPSYPKATDAWPLHTITGDKCLRFDWSKTDKDKGNSEGIEKVVNWVLASGATEVKHAAEGISRILISDLRKRCCTKFTYMRNEWRKAQKSGKKRTTQETASGGAQEEEELGEGGHGDHEEGGNDEAGEGDGGDGEGGGRNTLEETRRSFLRVRAEKTAEQRKRKAEGTEWEDAKYAAAFLPNAMSDNEDMPTEPGKAKSYIARAPWYRSKTLQDIYDALDARPDPMPDKAKAMVSRIRGPIKQGIEPPKARRLDTRLRVWQIDEEALAKNPHWSTSGRVAPNGKAWGDAEDPVDDGPANAKGKGRGGAPKIRRPEGAGDVTEARAQFKAATSGVDIDGLFAN